MSRLSLRFTLLLPAALACAAFAAPRPGPRSNPAPRKPRAMTVESIVAWINNKVITTVDYRKALQEISVDARSQNPPPTAAQLAAQKKNLLRDLIDQQLLLQRASDLGYSAESQTIHELDQIRQNMHLPTMRALRQAVQAQGQSYADFRQNIKHGILTQLVIQQDVAPRIDMPPGAVRKYYEKHKSQFISHAGVDLSEILISTQGVKKSAVPRLHTLAEQVQQRAARGEQFSKLAKTYSNGATADKGGSIGFFKKGTLAPQLEKIVFALPAGGVTPVLNTANGYLILKVDSKHPAGQETLAQARPQVEQQVYEQLLQPELKTYLENLRAKAYIKIAKGYVDTGAGKNPGVNITHFMRVLPQDLPKKIHHKTSGGGSGFGVS